MEEDSKALTYRVRGLPLEFDRAEARTFLLAALNIQNVLVDSLARDGVKQVATIRLSERSPRLQNIHKIQWYISANEVTVHVDTHFGGFTPLHDSEGPEMDHWE